MIIALFEIIFLITLYIMHITFNCFTAMKIQFSAIWLKGFFLWMKYTFLDNHGDFFPAINKCYSKDSNVTIFFNREHIQRYSHEFWEEKDEKERGWEEEAQKYEKPCKINVKDVGGRLSSLWRLMIRLVWPLKQLMWNRLFLASQVQMTGHHRERTKE